MFSFTPLVYNHEQMLGEVRGILMISPNFFSTVEVGVHQAYQLFLTDVLKTSLVKH